MDGSLTGNRGSQSAAVTQPLMYLVLTNISKAANIRSLLLTAASFGCAGVFVVGQPQFDFSIDGTDIPKQLTGFLQQPPQQQQQQEQGAAAPTMFIRRFDKWHECVSYLREHGIQLVGIEIHEDAQNIEDFVAQGPSCDVAFLPGNEGQGLHAKQMESCDAFCIISQYGRGTASLNVNVATSIVLHRFHQYQKSLHQARLSDQSPAQLRTCCS